MSMGRGSRNERGEEADKQRCDIHQQACDPFSSPSFGNSSLLIHSLLLVILMIYLTIVVLQALSPLLVKPTKDSQDAGLMQEDSSSTTAQRNHALTACVLTQHDDYKHELQREHQRSMLAMAFLIAPLAFKIVMNLCSRSRKKVGLLSILLSCSFLIASTVVRHSL